LDRRLDFAAHHNHGESLGGRQASRRVELAALKITFEGFAEDAIPALHWVQLLRSLPQAREEASDPPVDFPRFVMFAMRTGDGQRHLPGMLGLSGDRLHQQGTAGDRLGSMIGIGQTDEQAPPVEDQRNAVTSVKLV
jgi:hypothetical protein